MCLLPCFFGKGARRERSPEAPSAARGLQAAQAQASSVEVKTSSCAGAASSEARRTSAEGMPPTRTSNTAKDSRPRDKPAASTRGSPVASRSPASLATQLLDGLTFSTRILGVGAYGLVLHGSFDGLDVAVKFMVSRGRADRAAVQEVTVGGLPALTHPHVCKVYDTRFAVMTHALFDELEAHRERQQRRAERQRRLLQQQPQITGGGGGAAIVTAVCGGDVGQPAAAGEQDARRLSEASSRRTSNGRRRPAERLRNPTGERLLQFHNGDARGPFSGHLPGADRLRPLESSSPLCVLHEVLFRLGASTDHSVTLVIMEHCAKGNLSRAIHRGIFEPCELWGMHVARRALLRTAAEIARAMLHLHKAGVVHGDIKPANILLASSRSDRRGFVAKVGDFGLSHLLPDGATSLDTNTWGTPSYMAPEAMLGHAGTASDVWSFGVMLSEALTRQMPYSDVLEPASIVAGILDGSLELAWPAVRAENSGSDGGGADDAAGEPGAAADPAPGTAALLARQYGLVFPPTKSARSLAAGGGTVAAGGRAAAATPPMSLMGTGTSVEYGGGGTGTGTTVNSVASVAATAMLNTMTGTNDTSAGDGAAATGSAAGGGAAAAGATDEDLDRVLACLVNLGRRCTDRDPARRPCFSEILGELIDMEIILKTSKPNRPSAQPSASAVPPSGAASAAAREVQDIGARARSRLSIAAAATATAAVGAGEAHGNNRGRAAAAPPPGASRPAAAAGPRSNGAEPGPSGDQGNAAAAPRGPVQRLTAMDLMNDFLKELGEFQSAYAARNGLPIDPDAIVLTATTLPGGAVRLRAARPRPTAAGMAALAAAAAAGLVIAPDEHDDDFEPLLLPPREPTLRMEMAAAPPEAAPEAAVPPPAAAAAAVLPPPEAAFMDPVPVLAAVEPVEPAALLAAAEAGGGVIDEVGGSSGLRPVGHVVVVEPAAVAAAPDAGLIATGPGPGTPDVSECCCVVSKVSQEPLA